MAKPAIRIEKVPDSELVIVKPSIEELTGRMIARLNSPSIAERNKALVEVGQFPNKHGLYDAVIRLLDDPKTRANALHALGSMAMDDKNRDGIDAALPKVLTYINDDDQSIREAVIRFCGLYGDEKTIGSIIDALPKSKSPTEIMRAVARSGNSRPVALLVQYLKHSEVKMRLAATDALGKIGDKRAVGPLIERLNDSNPIVRSSAAFALAGFGHLNDERIYHGLAVLSRDSQSAAPAMVALGYLRDKRATGLLAGRVSDKDDNIRYTAVTALAILGDPKAEPVLITALSDSSEKVRIAAIKALEECGTTKAVPHLEKIKSPPEAEAAAKEAIRAIMARVRPRK